MSSAFHHSPRIHQLRRKPATGKIAVAVIAAGALLYILLNVALFMYMKGGKSKSFSLSSLPLLGGLTATPTLLPTPTLAPTPTPTPKPLLSKGTYEFRVSTMEKTEPAFSQGSFSPVDANVGQKQSYSLDIKSTSPVTKVVITYTTDHKNREIPMSLSSGTAQNGTWSATWTLDDTHDYKYELTTIATSENQQSNDHDLSFR